MSSFREERHKMHCIEFYCSSGWSVSYKRKRHKSLERHELPVVSWTWWMHVEGMTRDEKRCVCVGGAVLSHSTDNINVGLSVLPTPSSPALTLKAD